MKAFVDNCMRKYMISVHDQSVSLENLAVSTYRCYSVGLRLGACDAVVAPLSAARCSPSYKHCWHNGHEPQVELVAGQRLVNSLHCY
jgi:hypothetical protein